MLIAASIWNSCDPWSILAEIMYAIDWKFVFILFKKIILNKHFSAQLIHRPTLYMYGVKHKHTEREKEMYNRKKNWSKAYCLGQLSRKQVEKEKNFWRTAQCALGSKEKLWSSVGEVPLNNLTLFRFTTNQTHQGVVQQLSVTCMGPTKEWHVLEKCRCGPLLQVESPQLCLPSNVKFFLFKCEYVWLSEIDFVTQQHHLL